MARRTLTIKQGASTLITLHSGPENWAEADFTVTDVEGFDSWANIEIETVPKLFGSGSYVVSKRITEKEMTIEGSVRASSVRSYYLSLRTAAASLNPVSVALSGSAIETVEAYIIGLDWDELSDDEANFVLTLKAVGGSLN